MPQKVRQTIYSLPKKRPKSGQKVEQAMKRHRKLLAMQEKGDTAQIRGDLKISSRKILKYDMMHLIVAEQAAKKAK